MLCQGLELVILAFQELILSSQSCHFRFDIQNRVLLQSSAGYLLQEGKSLTFQPSIFFLETLIFLGERHHPLHSLDNNLLVLCFRDGRGPFLTWKILGSGLAAN